MVIETVKNDKRTQLRLSLEKYTNSYIKRNISLVTIAHSEFVASLDLTVTGKRGGATKNIILVFNELNQEWEVYCDGKKYILLSLGELSIVIKTMIQQLSTVLGKI